MKRALTILLGVFILVAIKPAFAQSDAVRVAEILKSMSDASINYAAFNKGPYPINVNLLINAQPPFLAQNYCAQIVYGYGITCTTSAENYKYSAAPSGSSIEEISFSSGGVSTEATPMENNIAAGKEYLRFLGRRAEDYYKFIGHYPAQPSDIFPFPFPNPCGTIQQGFQITCENSTISYRFVAKPVNPKQVGTQVFQITTGFVLIP